MYVYIQYNVYNTLINVHISVNRRGGSECQVQEARKATLHLSRTNFVHSPLCFFLGNAINQK